MQQTSSSEMEGGQMNTQQQENNGQSQSQQQLQQYSESQNDDFIEQMLSTIPNCPWPPTPNDLPSSSSNPTNTSSINPASNFALKPGDSPGGDPDASAAAAFQYPFDEASLVAKLRQQQMNEVTAKSLLLQHQQQFLMSRRSPADAMLAMPLSLGSPDTVDNSPFRAQAAAEASVQALYNGLAGSVVANGQPANQQHFQPPPLPTQGGSLGGGQNCRSHGAGINQASPASASTGGNNGAAAPQKQRVRARRGQATDPHSIAERLRRERIAERMKALQELVPNANKTDKASMLDEIIDYVKFLQLQVKVLSMSRLGGAAAVAPLVANMTSEGGVARNCNENQTTSNNDSITISEHQVAKLLEEDMGSAMQYLQGKGLCLMPISLASAISSATSVSRTPSQPHGNNNGNLHDINASNSNHPFHSSMPLTNGEGDDPTPNSSVKDPSNS